MRGIQHSAAVVIASALGRLYLRLALSVCVRVSVYPCHETIYFLCIYIRAMCVYFGLSGCANS